jgi:hypothetical protein
MAQGIFLHDFNTGGKLYTGGLTTAHKLTNQQYVTDNAALQSNNLSDLADASTARSNLGVAIGSNVQAYSARLAELASISQADGSFVVSDGTSFIFESAATARASMGVDPSGTDNSTDITLGSVSGNYLTLSGQEITAGTVPVSLGGTGSTTAAGARSALSVDPAGTDNSTDVTLSGKDYASISGQAITFAQIDLTDDVTGTLPIANGGTGSATAPMVSVITAANAGDARTALGLALGSDVQAFDAQLSTLAAFTAAQVTRGIADDNLITADAADIADNDFARFTATGLEGRSYAETLADLSGQAAADFSVNSQKITNVATPTASTDAANKGYVDGVSQGLDIKGSVRVASTANVAGSYSSNVLTVTSSGVLTIDGGNIALNERVLLKDQTTGTQNGIYKCSTAGASGLNTQPNTSSAYTGGDASYGSSSSVSGITFTSQTFSGSVYVLQYSNYSGSTVSIGVGDAIIVTAGSDTVAVAASSAHTLNNGGSGTISFNGGGTIAAYSNASSISVTSGSTMAIRALSYGSLISLFPSTTINAAYSSVSLTSAWGGGTIPAGKYIRFRDYSNNAWYYVVSSALSNGDTTLSMAFDSDDSYNTSPAFYGGSTTDFAMFDGQTPSSGTAAVLTRADDFNSDADITAGAFCFVEEGTVNADAGFVLSTDEPITLDTTALAFEQFSGAGSIEAGNGLSKSGNALSADLKANGGVVIESGALAVDLGASSITGTLAISDGGTGATSAPMVGVITAADAAAARTVLSAQASDAQLDTLAGLTANQVAGLEDLAALEAPASDGQIIVATGAGAFAYESGATARTSLGVSIGSDVQAFHANLADISSISQADGAFIVSDGTDFVAESGATARASLGLTIGTHVLAYDDQVQNIADLSLSDGDFLVANGSGAIVAESAQTVRTSMGLGSAQGNAFTILEEDLASAGTNPSSIANVGAMKGLYIFDLSGADEAKALQLPTTASQQVGTKVVIKIKDTIGSGASLVISGQSSQQIEGNASVTLDQNYQSITLVIAEAYTGSGNKPCWILV